MADFNQGDKVGHPNYGEGIVKSASLSSVEVLFETGGAMQFSKSNEDLELISPNMTLSDDSANDGFSWEEMEDAIYQILDKYNGVSEVIPLGEKWTGGTVTITPADPELQSKEIPIDTFFHKIVMVRDRLRVLEQNINSHNKLNDEEKVHLQQYITRAYGSLTSFNVLFKHKGDQFKGAGK